MHLQYLLIVAQRVRLGFQPSPPMAKYKNLSARSDTVDVKSIPEGSPKALTKSPAASGVEASRGSLLCTHPQRAPAHNTLLYSTPLTKHNGEQRHHDACVCGNGMRRRVWLPMTADNQWLTHSATHQHRKLQLDPAGLAARPYDPPCCVQRTRARQTWVCGAGTPRGPCRQPVRTHLNSCQYGRVGSACALEGPFACTGAVSTPLSALAPFSTAAGTTTTVEPLVFSPGSVLGSAGGSGMAGHAGERVCCRDPSCRRVF